MDAHITSVPSFVKPIPIMAKANNCAVNLEPKGPFELRLADPVPPPIFTQTKDVPEENLATVAAF